MQDLKETTAEVAALRSTFSNGHTKSYEWRMSQLKAMQRLMIQERKELTDAVFEDLHKSEMEGYLFECNLVEAEIQLFIDNLHSWMQPESRHTNLLNQPARSFVQREPHGVVLIIGAYNYPILLTLHPLVGCLAGGNCAMVKVPSPLSSPATSSKLAALIRRYLDPAAVKVVEGDREAVEAVLAERWDLIFFTGSSRLGRIVAEAAGRQLIPVVLELGGQNPCVVDRTAAVDLAARRIVWGALVNCGQSCARPDYTLVHADVWAAVQAQFKACLDAFYQQDPKAMPWFGRLPNAEKWQSIQALLNTDRAYVQYGGEADEADRYVAPTLLCFPDLATYAASAAGQAEIFGPILPLIPYTDLDAAIAFINQREKPLAVYVFTGDNAVATQLLSETSSGAVSVNEVMLHFGNFDLPFGGVGHSGQGKYHGRASFDTFTHPKAVLWKPNLSFLDAPIRYPPYNSLKTGLLYWLQRPRPAWYLSVSLRIGLLAVLLAIAPRLPKERLARAIEAFLA